METFFYAAFSNNNFHGLLSTAPVHVICCFSNGFHGAIGVGKQKIGMPMPFPQLPQPCQCQVRKGDNAIFMAFAGVSQNIMPQGAPFGHVDALIKRDEGAIVSGLEGLKRSGVHIVGSYEQFAEAGA